MVLIVTTDLHFDFWFKGEIILSLNISKSIYVWTIKKIIYFVINFFYANELKTR